MSIDVTAPTQPEADAGTRIGAPDERYEMRSLLGRGGMGEVWLARDARIERDVAIKLMRADAASDPEAVTRFLREAKVQGSLDHPGIVPVHDIGTDATPYFTMKRLVGTTLHEVLAKKQWSMRALLARFVDVCLAVELAHRGGIVHRDLKPANIMLGDLGETYVIDWGLARVAGADADATAANTPAAGQTETGTVMGTPGYMSPEQARGEQVDHRTDIYSLGCILYKILAGQDVPPELDDLCTRATAEDRSKRLGSAREMADEIQRFLDGDRDLARRRTLADEHAALAEAAMTGSGDEARATAMREAGRALALDPTNARAQALLAHLLLERPAEVPAEARERLVEERARTTALHLRSGALLYPGFAVIALVAGIVGNVPPLMVGIVLAGLATLGVFAFALARRAKALTAVQFGLLGMLHMSVVAVIGMCTGPLVVLPILVLGFLPLAITLPGTRHPVLTALFCAFGFMAPFAVEWLGIMPHTYSIAGDTLVIHSSAMSFGWIVPIVVTLVLAQLAGTAFLLDRQRGAQERMYEDLRVQTWHLEQLLPASARSAERA